MSIETWIVLYQIIGTYAAAGSSLALVLTQIRTLYQRRALDILHSVAADLPEDKILIARLTTRAEEQFHNRGRREGLYNLVGLVLLGLSVVFFARAFYLQLTLAPTPA
jgi:hypothetical protein